MKISVNDKELYSLNDTKKKVIQNQIREELFEQDMKRRLQWVLMHKYHQCFSDLKKEWDPKLAAAGIDMIPTDPDKYAELVFSQPTYKGGSQRYPDMISAISKK